MNTFTASDGSIITYDEFPTLTAIGEFLSYVYAERVKELRARVEAGMLLSDFVRGSGEQDAPHSGAPGDGGAGGDTTA